MQPRHAFRDVGISVWLYHDALSADGGWTGISLPITFKDKRLAISLGEQLLLLAKRGGGGDGVWRVEGETDKRGQLW